MNSFYLFLMKPTFTQAALWFDISPESAIFLPVFFFFLVHITFRHCYGKWDHKSISKYLISILFYSLTFFFFWITYYVIISLVI